MLKIFKSDQLGLLINRTFVIITQYKFYNYYDNIGINYWNVISTLSQKNLSNFFLLYIGCLKVSIGSFKLHENNSAIIYKLEIVIIEYIPDVKIILRVYSCFNRLD